jgi:transposase-like protein
VAEETKNGAELPEDIQRWTAKRRAALVLTILRGETSVQEAARKHDLTVAEVEHWKETSCWRQKTPCGAGRRTRRP